MSSWLRLALALAAGVLPAVVLALDLWSACRRGRVVGVSVGGCRRSLGAALFCVGIAALHIIGALC